MSDSTMTAFQKDIEAVRRDLQVFAKHYEDFRYSYYYAKPPAPVPTPIWHYIADDYETVAYKELDVSPDGTACVRWREKETFDVKAFKLLCIQCCKVLWTHANLLATVAEVRAVVEMPPGHHQWIRLIHRIAGSNSVWSGLVNKSLLVSQRPYEKTKEERQLEWLEESSPEERCPLEEEVVRTLNEQGISVPDVWHGFIPHNRVGSPIAEFHADMLAVLAERVRHNCPDDSGQSPMATETTAAETGAEPDLIRIKMAGDIVGIHRSNARNKAAKYGILQFDEQGHPLVSKKKWLEIIEIAPPKRTCPKRHMAIEPVDDLDIDDCIAELFDKNPGKRFTVSELLDLCKKKYPNLTRPDVLRALHGGKQRGDYDDDDGCWFRCRPE